MINNKGIVKVSPGIEYINAWRDHSGQYQIDRYVSSGRVIINKMVTGCGFTTYCLRNDYDTILIAPRLRLIQDKLEQEIKNGVNECYYFNREKDSKGNPLKTIDDLQNEFQSYKWARNRIGKPLKILVTYDSFCRLADMLELAFSYNISKTFKIAIDESHSLIKDVKLKEFHNKCVLSQFIARLFNYDNLLFISATPIIHYVGCIPEFQNNSVDYYELEWSNVTKVIQKPYRCKSAKDAFDQIYRHYRGNNGCFDAKYNVGAYSTEAVIFLNSVKDITSILTKYISKNKLINVADVTIICADNKENQAQLHKIDKGLDIIKSIPKYGELHTRWTFVTRTAFEGVDFYSPCASTYVIANYYIPSLSLDIASDIPQIIGRQRRKDNLFRDTIHIYYVNNINVVDDNEYNRNQWQKIQESNNQIRLWQTSQDDLKGTALKNLITVIEKDPNALYVTTTNGYPEFNQLVKVSEDYCRDILKNQVNLFVLSSNTSGTIYRMEIQQLKTDLANISSCWVSEERMRIIANYFQKYPSLSNEIFDMLRNEGYNQLGYYFSQLPIDRIQANGYRMSNMDKEIAIRYQTSNIGSVLTSTFISGQVYSKKEVKETLQDIYDRFGLKKTAKATDLSNFLAWKDAKKDGLKAMRIL